MTMRSRALALLFVSCAGLAWAAAPPTPPQPPPRDAAELFGLTKVWDFHLVIAPKEWEAMQPPVNSNWFGAFPKVPPKGKGPAKGKGTEKAPPKKPPPGAFGF